MSKQYADIIIDISHENLDRTFQYAIPDELVEKISVGDRVIVPFGKNNREITGFVLGLSDALQIDPAKIKNILSVVSNSKLVESKLLSLADWMRKRYGATMNHALKIVFPVKKNVRALERRIVSLAIPVDEAKERLIFYESKHQVARYRLLNELITLGALDKRIVTGKLNISSATLKIMSDGGVIEISSERVYRNIHTDVMREEKLPLFPKQQEIADDFYQDYTAGKRGTYLLFGVTGSGKTEVYMEMIERVVATGKSVIVLIPEISLTYQTMRRFIKRFGDRVALLHSKLSEGERYDQFERARKHEVDIMIGPRSALFTPFDNIGLIVIDEEHEPTYKSEQIPKYHAREVAIELARLHNASVVLGSATPSVESYNKALSGEYKLYSLDERAGKANLPEVEIVDLREELASGNKSIFSRKLQGAIKDRLEKHEQIMLFLNRRGYSGFVSCRSCGAVQKCPHCDVSLTQHKNGKMVCHYCGYEIPAIKQCSECKSKLIGGMKAGTEAVEEKIKSLFPYANVLRMDADTTKNKDDYEEILASFSNREADILVGTQMIVKGHDFPFVTLVGILAADMSLNGSDYRASERTFQLLVQAAGRAGRAERSGEVIIQTYQPDHYAVSASIKQDYKEFYEEEMGYRSLLNYPPVGHMLAVLIEAGNEAVGKEYAQALAGILRNDIINFGTVIGPASATVKKISDIFRYVIYVKGRKTELLTKAKDVAEAYLETNKRRDIRVTFDLDPMNGY